MRSEDRRDLATATTGAAGLAAGGVGRHRAVSGLDKAPRVHAVGVLRRGTKGQKRLYLASSALGLASAPALAVGATRLATGHDIEKAAWKGYYPVPPKVGRVPRHKVEIEHGEWAGNHKVLARVGGRRAAELVSRPEGGKTSVELLHTDSGFMRRGLAGRLVEEENKRVGGRLVASPNRTRFGEAFTRKIARTKGVKVSERTPDMGDAKGDRFRRVVVSQNRSLSQHGILRQKNPNRVSKSEPERGFWAEGLRGSVGALRGRAENAVQPVPKEVRATQLGVAASAGLGGSALARQAMRGRAKIGHPVVGPVVGGLTATASLPLTNKLIERRGYVATANGVKRTKTAPVKPSSRASVMRSAPRSFREDVGKIALRRTYHGTQRPGASEAIDRDGFAPTTRTLDGKDFPGVYTTTNRKDASEVYANRALDPKGPGRVREVYTVGPGKYHTDKNPTKNPGHLTGARYRHDQIITHHEEGKGPADSGYAESRKAKPVPAISRPRLSARSKVGLGLTTAGGLGLLATRRREPVGKADSYLGSRTPHMAQRAAITAAGHPPIVGPLTQAAAAGSYAPPGQQKKQALRQYGMASFAPIGVGVAGAYGGAALADRSPRFERGAARALDRVDRLEGAVRSKVGMKPKVGLMDKPATSFAGRNRDRFLGSKPGKALLGANPAKWKARSVGAGAGFLGAKMAAGAIGGQAAISLNQRDQNRYNAKHGIVAKSGADLGTRAERQDLAGKKRLSAGLSAGGGVAGLTSLALLMRGKKNGALTAGSIGGGLGGLNALLNVPIQRKEAKAIDPVKKAFNLAKKDSLEIRHADEHPKLLRQYGDKGPLPSKLDRQTKMKAYEARYVHHGGDKADKWGRRAEAAEGVRNAGLAGATVGGAAWLATRTKRGGKVASRVTPRAKHLADTVAVGSGVIGGAAELYGEHARGRRASYTNSPAGVAGSALRRMRDYTPD